MSWQAHPFFEEDAWGEGLDVVYGILFGHWMRGMRRVELDRLPHLKIEGTRLHFH